MSDIMMEKVDIEISENESIVKPFFFGILSVLLFVFGHTRSMEILLYAGTLLMLMNFMLFSKHLLYLELFYIPLATILKFSPNGAALFSYISIFGIVISLINSRVVKIKLGILFSLSGLLCLLLLKELFQSFGMGMNYIRLLLIMLSVFICISTGELKEKINFDMICKANVFFSTSVLLASVLGYIYADNIKLSQYFSTTDQFYLEDEIVSRFCGVSADPNYYSSIVIFAIATNLFIYLYRSKIRYIVSAAILAFFGLLSLSKMFLILFAAVLLLFVIAFVRTRNLSDQKSFFVILITCVLLYAAGVLLINSNAVQVILERMSGDDVNSITTGRSDTWIGYIDTITDDFNILFFGTNDNSAIVGVHNTHNTLLQIVWKVGLVGLICVITWFVSVVNIFEARKIKGTAILLVGALGALFAIDLLFFEQLFWFFIFLLLCRKAIDNEIKLKSDAIS